MTPAAPAENASDTTVRGVTPVAFPDSSRAQVGITHVAGSYVTGSESSFVLAGAQRIAELGVGTIKVYMTPEYRTKYPEAWDEGISDLRSLAQSRQFRALFAMPFHTYVITTYGFSMGVDHPWRYENNPARLAAEAAELEALTSYLLTTYAGSGKTFILQNWEGDWAMLGGYDPALTIPSDRAERMAEWLRARQQGVERARNAIGEDGVRVRHAVEVNRLLDARDGRENRVVNSVLPNVNVDAVSYSAWEALELDPSQPVSELAEGLHQRITDAVTYLRGKLRTDVPVYLGEVGFAESRLAERGVTDVAPLIESVVSAADDLGLSHVVYWQVFDNECSAGGTACPGFWVVKPDGSLSVAGQTLRAVAGG